MKKLAAVGLGVALAAATLTTTPQPAKADAAAAWLLGGLAVGLIVAHHYHRPNSNPLRALHPSHWLHTHWCHSRYRTYNSASDTYAARPGERVRCVSPYSG